jgi:hypothetical protein
MRHTRRVHAGMALAGCVVALAATTARAQTEPPPAATAEPEAAAPPPAATPPPPPAPAPPQAAPPRPAAPAPYPYPYPYPYPAYPYPYPAPAPYPYYPPPPTAAPPPPAAASAPVETLAAAPAAPRAARLPATDAQADRGVLLPTAYTHPAGTFFMSSYELAILQLGYALTDDVQLSLTGLPPLGDEAASILDLTLKVSLHRGPLLRVAALGSTSGVVSRDIGVVGLGRVGAVAQMCFQLRCDDSVSLSSNVALAGALAMVNGVSGIYRASRLISFVGELDTLVPLGNLVDGFGGALWGAGLRFNAGNWGVDLAVLHVLGHAKATAPFLAITYRSAPGR